MGAPILWTPGKMPSFCRKNHVRKIPPFWGGVLGGGGADFIFMGARIFLINVGESSRGNTRVSVFNTRVFAHLSSQLLDNKSGIDI